MTTGFDQAGDVLTMQGDDGLEMNQVDGVAEMITLFDTMVYFCLMGGNAEDSNSPSTDHKQYMGNEDELPENQLRSRFYSVINGTPLNSETVKELREAAAFDISTGFGNLIDSVTVTVQLLTKNRVRVQSELILADGTTQLVILEIKKNGSSN